MKKKRFWKSRNPQAKNPSVHYVKLAYVNEKRDPMVLGIIMGFVVGAEKGRSLSLLNVNIVGV